MVVVVLILAFVLLVCVVLVLASWGITSSATGLTLGVSNAALATSNATLAQANTMAQTTITFLVIVLVVCLPLIAFGAQHLAMLVREWRNRTAHRTPPTMQPAQLPMIDATPAPLQLPAPRMDEVQPFVIPTRRIIKRTSHRTHRAARTALRMFK